MFGAFREVNSSPKRGTTFKIHAEMHMAGATEASEQLMSNSNFATWKERPFGLRGKSLEVLVLHAGAIWYYHGFLRDILMARHVTSLSVSRTLNAILKHKQRKTWQKPYDEMGGEGYMIRARPAGATSPWWPTWRLVLG